MNNSFHITPPGTPNDGILYVDHQKNGRTGHMGHALVEYAPGKILSFYPNCSAEDPRHKGHSGFGWMEYKRSEDGGETWSEPIIEPNSKNLFDQNIGRSFMCEKAVKTDTGRIILFYLQCDMITNGHKWEPYFEPYYAFSEDNGHTISEAKQLLCERGRIYDVLYHKGTIYVLFYANPEFPGRSHTDEHDLVLYTSSDNGETFEFRSKIPFKTMIRRYYGTMCFTPEDKLIVYTYAEENEFDLLYTISDDHGFHWTEECSAFFAKKLRNPQLIYYKDRYFIHGRGGTDDLYGALVLYTSPDGIHWDEGKALVAAGPQL